ncbi:MAG: hypothetical protein N2C14_31440, partial [Planctomycetales bacterium]
FSWKVLAEVRSRHFRPGEWNRLKVRVEKDKILCYLNGRLVIESADRVYRTGSVGLAKFRDTAAEFKDFQLGKQIPPYFPPEATTRRVAELTKDLDPELPPQPELLKELATQGEHGARALRDRAKLLESRARRLRELAAEVHRRRAQAELVKTLAAEEDRIDLIRAVMLLAAMDNDEVDVDSYCEEVDKLAAELRESLPAKADDKAKLAALNKFLFEELGFHGSRHDYYNRANSYLNEVLDDREGIPITLSVLYMEIGRRVGLRMVGVGMPGHFVVRQLQKQGEPRLIDAYDGGKILDRAAAEEIVKNITGGPLLDRHLEPVTNRAIVLRMLQHLMHAKQRTEGTASVLPYLDAVIALEPTSLRERWLRAGLCYQSGRWRQSLADIDWLAEHAPPELNREQLGELRQRVEKQLNQE